MLMFGGDVVGSGFNPGQLSGCQAWYDFSNSAYLTLSSTAITQALDRSGNGNHTAVQGTTTARPTFSSAQQNNLPTGTFDGGDRLLLPSGLYSIPNGSNTIFAISKRNTASGNQSIISMNIGVSPVDESYKIIFGNSAGSILFQNASSNGRAVTNNPNTTVVYNLITCFRTGTTQSISVNRGTAATNLLGLSVSTVDGGALGSQDEGALFLTGGIAELIMYNRALTAAEIAQVEIYLTNKWGTPNPTLAFDVFALMGQSNMVGQYGPIDPVLDSTVPSILQYGRNGANLNNIVPAVDPLDNIFPTANTIGLGMNFAKAYLNSISGRGVLLVPCAQGGTGFSTNNWNPGDALYEATITRINAAIAARSGSVFKGILWNQGEADRAWTQNQYATALDAMIADARSRITGGTTAPFVCGGNLVGGSQTGAGVAAALLDTPNRVAHSAYASSVGLVSGGDNIHFDAPSLRTFGNRYYTAYSGL